MIVVSPARLEGNIEMVLSGVALHFSVSAKCPMQKYTELLLHDMD